MYPDSIIKKVGDQPGKTVAIFAGIHGNEKVGILALNSIAETLKVSRGIVYLVYANPPAIEKNVRLINKNMNRLSSRSNVGDLYEYQRAGELMDLLDTCDSLLDIHSYNSESGDQFAISEPIGFDVLKGMDFPIIASGFSSLGNGTDDYMHKQNKVGVCIECGTTNKAEQFMPLAAQSIYQFLQYFGCIDKITENSAVKQRIFKAKKILYKKTDSFHFTRELKDFEILKKDEVYATDGYISHIASENESILFPRINIEVGGEAGIVGEFDPLPL